MRLDELEAVCREAARGVVAREGRPVPATVVLPLPESNKVTTFPDFPADDALRTTLLERFSAEVIRPANASCFGFLAEGSLDTGEGAAVDVVVVAYSARHHHAHVTAAPLGEHGLERFVDAEELDPAAMPFLAPLQAAVDAAGPPDAFGGALPPNEPPAPPLT